MKKNWTLLVLTLVLVSFALFYFGCSAGSGTGTSTGTYVTRVTQTGAASGQPDALVPTNFDYFVGEWMGSYSIAVLAGSTNNDWPWKNATVFTNGNTTCNMTIRKITDNGTQYASSLALDGNVFMSGPFESDRNSYATIVSNTNAPSNNVYGYNYEIRFPRAYDVYSRRAIFYDNRTAPALVPTTNCDFFLANSTTPAAIATTATGFGPNMICSPGAIAFICGIDSNKNAITDQTNLDFIYLQITFVGFEKIGEN